ncbi:hypothetical protein KFE98_07530 [bacterium SCSIO 12741]|nr:hypothetical protein KFE98_07530 [bacterium SCSIO 12741]
MKKVLLAAFILLAQVSLLASIPEFEQPTYRPVLESGEQLYLPMEFGKSSFSITEELRALDASSILKIEIVCTDYPKGINLKSLNGRRLKALETAKPELDLSQVFTRVIRQMNCPSEQEARDLFHGLVITYRPTPTPETRKEEWKKLESLLSGKVPEAIIPTPSPSTSELSMIEDVPSDDTSAVVAPMYTEFMEDLLKTLPKDAIVDTVSGGIRVVIGSSTTVYHTSTFAELPVPIVRRDYQIDSTIFKIMGRHPEWKDMLITADLTGSMYPYVAQILTWLQLNSNDDRVKSFVFFNDGNWTPDREKVIGSTGGIYQGNFSSYPDVKALAQETMRNGGGGDGPENNIEALIEGMKGQEYYQEVVLIADSWAPVKDIRLLNQIKSPVRVVICGGWGSVHPDYLKIARETGGSIHTMEEDLKNLIELNDGETIELGGFTYKLEKGSFYRVTQS